MNPLFAILVVCSIVLIIFLTLTIIAIWKRSRRKKPPVVKAHRRDSENTFQSTEATITKIDQNGLEEIGNPDVIPNKNGTLGWSFLFPLLAYSMCAESRNYIFI